MKSAFKSFPFLALAFFCLVSAPSNLSAADDSFNIALSLDIEGKGGWNTCNVFAKDLYDRLCKAGGEAHYIVYDWADQGFSGRHAIVVYRDSSGRYWGIDQLSAQPKWVEGSSPQEWAYWFAAPREVMLVYTQTEPRLAGRYANLSKTENVFLASRIVPIPDPLPLNHFITGKPMANPIPAGDAAIFERSLIQRFLFRSKLSIVLR